MAFSPLGGLRRIDAWFLAPVPAERLTWLRFGVGVYAFIYLVTRAGHLNAPAAYPAASFAPVGIVSGLEQPLAAGWVYATYALSVLLAAPFALGIAHRVLAPVFALLLLWVLTYRHSFGMIFHTDNLLVLHVLCLSLSSAAGARVRAPWRAAPNLESELRSGWVIRLCSLLTVASYVIAGIAKLRSTGLEWALGDVLREHIAYDAIRKIELGSIHSPIGPWLLPHGWLFPPLAAFSLITELSAPLALLGERVARVWCLGAWLFHLGVLALMAIAFPYALSGCVFLCFFPLERWVAQASAYAARRFSSPRTSSTPTR